jgi:hypothetical protein
MGGKDKAGPAAGKGGGGTGGGGASVGSHLLLLGSVLFLVSWFVPVVRGQELFGGLADFAKQLGATPDTLAKSGGAPDWLHGWPACTFAWNLMLGEVAPGMVEWKQRLAGSTCLTNGLMVLAILGALVRARSGLLGFLLIGCAWVNASWIYLNDTNPLEWAAAGYWLWLASFVLVGAGSMLARRRS